MKSINVRYFALLREEAKTDSELITINCHTYAELYEFLREKHHFTLPLNLIQVAVNDEFSTLNDFIKDGARVVFIPPVAGG